MTYFFGPRCTNTRGDTAGRRRGASTRHSQQRYLHLPTTPWIKWTWIASSISTQNQRRTPAENMKNLAILTPRLIANRGADTAVLTWKLDFSPHANPTSARTNPWEFPAKSPLCLRYICSLVPTSLTVSRVYEQRTLYGALVVTSPVIAPYKLSFYYYYYY